MVPGPKKSPSAPAGTSNWFGLVIGTLHAGVGHRCGCVGEIVHRRRQRGDVGDVVRAGIVAVEQIEELDERHDLPALSDLERPGDAQINLDVRGAAELVHRGLHAVDDRAIIGWIAKSVHVHRRGQRNRAGGSRPGMSVRHLKAAGNVHDAAQA